MYRKRIFGLVGDFNEALRACEDYELYLRIAKEFPFCYHDEVIAEYRRHEGNMTTNAGLLLKTMIGVQRSQKRFARQDRLRWQAYKDGITFVRRWYGDPLVEQTREQVSEGSWRSALKGAYLLARYYPRGLALVVNDKPLLERRLRAYEEEARLKQRQLKDRRNELHQQRRQLEERTQQITRLRGRVRQLQASEQELQQHLREAQSSRFGKVLGSFRLFRAKPPATESERPTQRVAPPAGNPSKRPQEIHTPKATKRKPQVGQVQFGSLRWVDPISPQFGYDRGRPVDRYYIENFLARHADDIQEHVLEVGDASYTRQYGGARVRVSDVLHVDQSNPEATIVADLTRADHIASDTFDCIILTQTLHLIYDVRSAIRTIHRTLKPGGVLLATFPGISQIARDEWGKSWYWAFTSQSARRLFGEAFPADTVQVRTYGNVLAAISFLHGLAAEELREAELDKRDPAYEVLITLRAVKPQTVL
jgi:SAM-dependent methyltransferase/uncharacterized membrane-anchored protein YhcB (DUF1043 family)